MVRGGIPARIRWVNTMLKSCKYCGKIHDSKFQCSKKPSNIKKITDKDKFRWSKVWQRKREEIKERDNYICQVCYRQLYDTYDQFNYNEIEVHHAVPLEVDFDKRLDNYNLITLCSRHHEMAERQEIPLEKILEIISEQESNTLPRGW